MGPRSANEKYGKDELFDVATRIVEDGMDHSAVFRRMRAIVEVYNQSRHFCAI